MIVYKENQPANKKRYIESLIKKMCGVWLDRDQCNIIRAVETNRKVVVRSGHARGKDYLSAALAVIYLFVKVPSKVIMTAPTGRQVSDIMLAEVSNIFDKSTQKDKFIKLSNKIKCIDDATHFLEGFKAKDKATTDWAGYHSRNVLVIVTEASGIEDETFEAIEGLLTGNSKLLIVGNPTRTTGYFYNAFLSPQFKKFSLSCLDAINVKRKKVVIPGQVDYLWVWERVQDWCEQISESDVDKEKHDFLFDDNWYRPNSLFVKKVIGDFYQDTEETLVPLHWIERANNNYDNWNKKIDENIRLRLGADVAGMGRDMCVRCYRRKNIVEKFERNAKLDHMKQAGKIKGELDKDEKNLAFIDTIGEGAGVYSRLAELDCKGAISAKFSENASDLSDLTDQYEFANMRAYCYWAVRDWLNPKNNFNPMLPRDDKLSEELTRIKWFIQSSGKIIIEPKEKIKDRIGRSPDTADSLALTFYPDSRIKNFAELWGYQERG